MISNMKRILFFSFLMLLTAVLFVSCASGSSDGTDETVNTPLDADKGFAERLVGKDYRYVSGDTDEPDTYLDIYFINGFLIAEAKEPYAAYWAMEMIPADEDDLYSTTSDTMQVIAFFFSGFSNFGEYWSETEIYTLRITESGVDFTSADGSTVNYIRDDTLEAQHDPERYREPLIVENDAEYSDSMIGEWYGETADGTDIYLKIENDGTIQCLSKCAGEPVSLHIGLAVIDAENTVLTSMTERVGWSTMPWIDTVSMMLENDGHLILDTREDCGILPSACRLTFTRQEIVFQKLTLTTTAEKE